MESPKAAAVDAGIARIEGSYNFGEELISGLTYAAFMSITSFSPLRVTRS